MFRRSFLAGKFKIILTLIIALASTGALATIHVRVQTTLVGYDIGRLKAEEARLLEERSALRMQLAKLTNQRHLSLMTDSDVKIRTSGKLASK